MGKNTSKTEPTIEVPVSKVATTGFAIPPVVVVDANRVALVVPATAAAVPPPEIIAKAQVNTGLKSATVETITGVPATATKRMVTESNTLSI